MPPRKPKKDDQKKPEKGLQRLDTLFSKSAKLKSNLQKTKSDPTVIVLSDSDDDDFVKSKPKVKHKVKKEPGVLVSRTEKVAESNYMEIIDEPTDDTLPDLVADVIGKEQIPSSSSSASGQGQGQTSRRMLPFGGANRDSDDDFVEKRPRYFTPPTPPQSKRPKTEDKSSAKTDRKSKVKPEVHDLDPNAKKTKPFSAFKSTPKSASKSHPRGSQSCPVKRRGIPKGTGSPSKAWMNSPFRKFPIRKARSLPANAFKSLTKPDPYYLANFKFIIYTIAYDKFYDYLFNDEDRDIINKFKSLTREAKMLYIRLFQRKARWLQASAVKYTEIGEDLLPYFRELTKVNFFEDENSLTDLADGLNLLLAPDLRDLAKKYHVKCSDKQKTELVESLVNHSQRKTIGTMFGAKSNVAKTMLNDAKAVVGPSYRITSHPRALFTRMMMLFSLSSTAYEEENTMGGQQLFTILQINRGAVKYPEIKVDPKTRIYRSRDSLIEFQEAIWLDGDMIALMEKNRYEEAYELYQKALDKYDAYLKDTTQCDYDSSLPQFLQRYTAGCVYIRLLNHGVEVLQKLRRYDDANRLIKRLLEQELCPDYRGSWYDRLALNLESHLKNASEALDVIRRGLSDESVKVGRRLALFQRAERICKMPSHRNLKHRISEFEHPPLTEIPSVTIEGQLLPKSLPGRKSSFIRRSANQSQDDVILCSVEEVALAHYQDLGYDRGMHGEGTTLMTIMMVFMWDLVFDPNVPDAFHNQYQTAPLDLWTDDFYRNRKERIDQFLEWLKTAKHNELASAFQKSWTENKDTVCDHLFWDRFKSADDAKSLIRCLGGTFLSAVFRRHIMDMRHCRAGVPDLIVWNTTERTFKIVEVKGPGDRLSTKQILWLSYYLSLGADAEVCHVKGVGGKKLRKGVPSSGSQSSQSSDVAPSIGSQSSQSSADTNEIGSQESFSSL